MHLASITIDHAGFPTRDRYPFNLPLLGSTGTLAFKEPVTCFVGENGSGKSTLLRAIACACGVHRWGELDRERYEYNPHEDQLHRFIGVTWAAGPVPGSYFDSQTFRNFSRLVDEWAASDPGMLDFYGGRSLIAQSHGQSLMAYFKNRYTRRGIYFMDEPETALSPRTQIMLLGLLGELARAGHAQFVIATHSPVLLSIGGATIYSFDADPIVPIAYRDTEHYTIYRDFMREASGEADA